jgi:hypothetical protein
MALDLGFLTAGLAKVVVHVGGLAKLGLGG